MSTHTAGSISTSPADPVKSLEHLPLFYDFSYLELRKIAAHVRLQRFEPREEIFRAGDAGDRIYFVVSGLVRLTAFEGEAVQPEDFIVRSRGVFGEDCAFDESPRQLRAEALMRTECLVMSAHALRRIEDEHPRIALRLIRKLARSTSLRLRQAAGRHISPRPTVRPDPAMPAPDRAGTASGRLARVRRLLGSLRNWRGPEAVLQM